MQPVSPRTRNNQTYDNTEAGNLSSSEQRTSAGTCKEEKPPRPPLRRHPATYEGLNQPKWLTAFMEGNVPPYRKREDIAKFLWKESGTKEPFEAWDKKPDSEEAIHEYWENSQSLERWCIDNNEPAALLWLLETSNMHQLHWNLNAISNEDAAVWFEAIAKDVNITTLFFNNATLDGEMAKLFESCLSRKKNLVDLALRNVHIPQTPSGACSGFLLANGIAANQGLKALFLAGSDIEETDWIFLMEKIRNHSSLRVVHISNVAITKKQLTVIIDNINLNPHIQELHFSHVKLDSKQAQVIANFLSNNSSLKILAIENADLEAASGCLIAEGLVNNTSLTELNLSENKLNEEFAATCATLLQKNNHLETLILSVNKLGDKGAEALANALRTNEKLSYLCLQSNNIGEKGGLSIANMLASNPSLSQMFISNNACGPNVVKELSLSLQTNSSLQYLQHSECGFEEKDVEFIGQVVTRNTETHASRDHDAILFSRSGAGPGGWLPPEISYQIMNYLRMQSANRDEYESTATAIELAINAMKVPPQEKAS
ncbi:leucine-rich repeat domain-containing protein [Noviherbaspirillum soli]|uniref:hypothetical protein n=1 Tax=Noviherbaspirillum soli TaxID=1064518 RepID=UPI00188D00CE|nr:hypothetical protein [Noviherbaspirillum soli]